MAVDQEVKFLKDGLVRKFSPFINIADKILKKVEEKILEDNC